MTSQRKLRGYVHVRRSSRVAGVLSSIYFASRPKLERSRAQRRLSMNFAVTTWQGLFSAISKLFVRRKKIVISHSTPPVALINAPSLFALVIGINRYQSLKVTTLRGAVPDANAVQQYLESDLSVPSSHIRNLRDTEATRSAIIQAFFDLQSDVRIQRGDPILIFYAGHGGETDAPTTWETDGSKIQMLIPHDFRTIVNGEAVHGIPDRTIGVLLDRLAEEKGDNITVIFDCCHSGSGTRTDAVDPSRLARVTEVPNNIPVGLDQGIWCNSASGRDAKFASGFLQRGMQSHVLLAACAAQEQALEDQGRGVFTQALLFLLTRVGANKIRYRDVLEMMYDLPGQNPQCEGYHQDRVFFNSKVPYGRRAFYTVREDGNQYVMQAGAAHGVTYGAEFAVYQEPEFPPRTPPLETLVVGKILAFSSTLSLSPGATRFALPQPAYALQSKAGVEGFRLHIVPDETLTDLCGTLAHETQHSNSAHTKITLVEKERAEMDIGIEDGLVVFNILHPLVTQFGLIRMPFQLHPHLGDVCPVIRAAAHYHWHLRRTSKKAHFENQVMIEFMRLKQDEEDYDDDFNLITRPDGPNLNIGGVVDIVVDKDAMYGIKIINDTPLTLYPSLFYFDNSDLSITSYYQPPTAGKFKLDPPLPPKGFLTLGYGVGNSDAFNYVLRGGQDVDVGFLKLFLTTEPVDLSNIPQPSPFSRDNRAQVHVPHIAKTASIWDTILVTIVQRREPLRWET